MWAKIIIYSASRVVFAKLLYHTLRAVILHFLAFVAFLILFNKQSVKEGHIYLTTGLQKYVTLRHHCYPPKEIRNSVTTTTYCSKQKGGADRCQLAPAIPHTNRYYNNSSNRYCSCFVSLPLKAQTM